MLVSSRSTKTLYTRYLDKNFLSNGHSVFLPTSPFFYISWSRVFQQTGVTVLDDSCHIWHPTVADIDIASIAVFMMSWEVLINETWKYSTDVGFHIDTIWWIEPYIFSITIPSWWGCWSELNIFIEATEFKQLEYFINR